MNVRIARLCSFEVGTRSWDRQAPRLTVVVKATFDIRAHGCVEAAAQLPLRLDEPAPSGAPHQLRQASDFAPRKARCDVLLVGHARSEQPTTILPFMFQVGALRRTGVTMSAQPTTALPLLRPFLREPSGPDRSARVGPSAFPRDLSSLTDGSDFSVFNVAPEPQQLDAIAADVGLQLTGLLAGGDVAHSALPGVWPAVHMLVGAAQLPAVQRVPLRLDTLVIDSDSNAVLASWRGDVAQPAEAGEITLVVSRCCSERDAQWSAIAAQLAHGPSLGQAVTEASLRRGAARTRAVAGPSLEDARDEALRSLRATMEEPGAAALAVPEQTPTPGSPSASMNVPARGRALTQLVNAAVVAEAVLPFDAAPVGAVSAQLGHADPPIVSSARGREHTALVDTEAASAAPLPFSRVARRMPREVTPPRAVPSSTEQAPPLPRNPIVETSWPTAAAPPKQPLASAESAARLPLSSYAAIKAAWLQGTPLEVLLAEHELSERSWRLEERRICMDLAQEEAAGGQALALDLERALDAARAVERSKTDTAEYVGPISLEVYAAMQVEIEQAEDTAAVLAQLGITTEQWRELRRHWTRCAFRDPRIADQLRARLADARRGLG